MSARFMWLLCACLFLAHLPAANAQPVPVEDDFDATVRSFDAYWSSHEMHKGNGYKPFKRIQSFTEIREDQYGEYNPWAIREAWLERAAMNTPHELDNDSDWTPMGPFQPFMGSYVGGVGRVNAIAFHPTNPDVYYVGAATGGLWKTVDGGDSWFPLTDNIPVMGISDVVVHPEHPDTLFIATGDRDGARRRIPTYTVGVLMSPDGGETWIETGLNYELSEQNVVTGLASHPDYPEMLLAITLEGIWRSVDAGDTWTQTKDSGLFYDIEVNPDNPLVVYAAAAEEGIYRSTDGGQTWLWMTNGVPLTGFSRIELAIAPSNPDVVYALFADTIAPFYTGFLGIWRTTDGGDSWTLQADSPNILGWDINDNGTGGQGWFALAMAVDPTDADVIWTGSVNIWRSTNGGVDWETVTYWIPGEGLPYIHADIHILKYRGTTLYSGNDGGIYEYNAGQNEWFDQSNMLAITQVYRLGCDHRAAELDLMITGTQDNGSKQYDAGTWTPVLGGDGFDGGIDPANNQIRYGSIYYGDFRRTTDGGESWFEMNFGIQDQGAWITPFVIDSTVTGRLFRGHKRVYRSYNWGELWHGTANMMTNDFIRGLAVAPSDTGRVYACDWQYNFWRSEDGGQSFTTSFFPGMKPTYIAVSPLDPDRVYVSNGLFLDGEKVYLSEDGGDSWTNISHDLPNIPFNCIVVDTDRPSHLYAGSDLGVYFSPDDGATWELFNNGLPNVIINEMEIHRNSGTLVAGTFGRGSWRTPVEGAGSAVAEVTVQPSGWNVSALYPNPFNMSAVAQVNVLRTSRLTAGLYNMLGQQVRTLHDGQVPPGVFTVHVVADGLASGVYVLQTTIPGQLDNQQRVILLR